MVTFEDAQSFCEAMSKITNLRYEIKHANQNFPPLSDNSKWFLLAEDEIRKVRHARTYWIGQDGKILIQSMYLGNTTEWIESDYGENSAVAATKLNYPNLSSALKVFDAKFPLEAERLRAYQKILDEISSRYGIHLQLRLKGGKVAATFYIGASIDAEKQDATQLSDSVKLNLRGLNEAWDGVANYETNRRTKEE